MIVSDELLRYPKVLGYINPCEEGAEKRQIAVGDMLR